MSSTGVERYFCTSTRIGATSLLIFAVLTIGNALPSTIGAGRLYCSPKCRDFSQTPARISKRHSRVWNRSLAALRRADHARDGSTPPRRMQVTCGERAPRELQCHPKEDVTA